MKILLWLTLFFALTLSAVAQLSLGSVNNIQSVTCPALFFPGSTCSAATVSCPGIPDIGTTFGIKENAKAAGTIVFINGTGDTLPFGSPYFFNNYTHFGFSLAQFTFSEDWEDGGNVLASACRPATILNYLQSNPALPFCVQAASGGAGAAAYALSWYDIPLDNVEMMSGPVFSSIATGCQVPRANPVTVNPTNGAAFNDNPWYNQEWAEVSLWTNTACLPKGGSTSGDLASEAAQSIVQPNAVLSFPTTNTSGWVCNNGDNPSAAQSYLWFSQIVTPWNLTSISNCLGAEGVAQGTTPQGVLGNVAIAQDMVAQCIKHQKSALQLSRANN
jgi:hypothetical protein